MAKQAIPGSRVNAFSVDPESLIIIGLDTVDSASHPLYDERIKLALNEGLVRNIDYRGVLKPILVRKDGGAVEVVDGRQRVRAAREVNRRRLEQGREPLSVLVMLKRGDDADLFADSRSANEFHAQDNPMARARAALRLQQMGKSEEYIANVFGVTELAVENWLRLFDLSPRVQAAVESGQVSAAAASKLSDLSREEQTEALEKLIESGEKVTADRTAELVKAKKTGQEQERKIGKVQLRRLVDAWTESRLEEIEHDLSEDFIQGIKFATGALSSRSVKGLTEALRIASEKTKN